MRTGTEGLSSMSRKATHRGGTLIRRGMITAALAALSAASLLLLAAPASATLVKTHNFLSSFNGNGSVGPGGTPLGSFNEPVYVAVDNVTGRVFVVDSRGYAENGLIRKFHPNGTPDTFESLGPGVTTAEAGPITGNTALAYDNSESSSQGQFYVFQEAQKLRGYAASGVEFGGPNFPIEPFGDMCGAAVDRAGNIWWSNGGVGLFAFDSGGHSLEKHISTSFYNCAVAIDQTKAPSPTSGYFYVTEPNGATHAYDSTGVEKFILDTEGGGGVAVDPSNGHIYVSHYNSVKEYAPSTTSTPGQLLSTFGAPDPVHGFPEGLCGNTRGVAINGTNGNVYVTDCGKVDIYGPGVEYIIPTVTTDSFSVQASSAVLHGHVSADGGGDTTDCHFEYGTTTSYGANAPCVPVGPIHNADGNVAVSAEVKNLEPGTTYHFRVVASNPNGKGVGADVEFKPQGPPVISREFASDVNTDGAQINGTVSPEGIDTTYHFEYGTSTSYGTAVPLPDEALDSPTAKQAVSKILLGLNPGTVYHFRLVGSNVNGTKAGPDQTFETFSLYPGTPDPCPNAEVRKQTGASLLLDCRAYELASASYSGGYDVQSDLIPGQVSPPIAQPDAPNRVLYSLHYGAIPGIPGNPPNLGLDPYVAERGSEGWSTRYVGIAADGAPASDAFGSPLAASGSDLSTFAFGGEKLCSPCFADGTTGIPVRMANGSLVQGMKGSVDPGPGAKTAGYVGKALSADGSHLVFGSTSKFEPDGNAGEISIYDRDLAAGTTHVVSKKADGSGTMTGPGIGELDISSDGSRIVLGRSISTDSAGNTYWHPYMNIGDSAKTVDLAPSTTSGVLYDGMSADGSKVFFSTPDKLLGADTDNSADLYEADVAGNGTATLALVSTGTGGAGNSDACSPTGGKLQPRWNNVTGAATCDAIGFAGGAGVASGDGSIYFLSPEKLDGGGTLNAPNIFLKRPGSAPQFVATVEPEGAAVRNALTNNELHNSSDLQVTPSGDDAVFSSALPLTGYTNLERSEIYRYDAPAHSLACVSCASTGAAPSANTTLSSVGLNIADDGRVFFTSAEQLALRDTNKQKDAYEWENGVTELISSGASSTGSGLVTVSANGVDAFFFTRQVLSAQDHNGTAMKIYDARDHGGFFSDIVPPPCQASDECHGPGTKAAPAPQIATLEGSVGNTTSSSGCKKGHVKKHGKCVKKPTKRHPKRQNGRRHG